MTDRDIPLEDYPSPQHGTPAADYHSPQHGTPAADYHSPQHGTPAADYHSPQHGTPAADYLTTHYTNPGYQDNTLPKDYQSGRPVVVDLHGNIPLDERYRHDSDASSYHSDNDDGQRPTIYGKASWAALDSPRETAALLESLPSRQLERLASEIGKKGTLRHQPRRHKSANKYNTLRFPHGANVASEIAAGLSSDPDLMDELDGEQRTNEVLKDIPMTLANKRKIKREMSNKAVNKGMQKKPSWWKQAKYRFGIAWMHFKYQAAELGYYLQLWKSHLKKIEGHFGTGVLSYFLFLKWIFYINIPIFILNFGFVIIPQILYRWYQKVPRGYSDAKITFTGRELITGAYWFGDTEMYYGAYTNESVSFSSDTEYHMPYAYLFTSGGYYLLSLVILLLSISKSYKKNYIEGSGAFNFYNVTRVFCGWDYGITAKDAASLRHKGIYNEIKEYLSGVQTEKKESTLEDACKSLFLRLITNLVVFALIGGSGYLIYVISKEQSFNNDLPVLSEMAMPLCVSGINLILPFIFHFIGRMESYQKPKNELWIEMLRTMLLKAVTLAVLVYFWFDLPNKFPDRCWESFVGQEIYRLVVVDFIFTLVVTFLVEFVRRQMARCFESLGAPEFGIARNTLNLIYSQALCWLGTFYCPLLSFIMIIKLFIIFYVKRISVIQNCKPSLRPWRAARSHTIFLVFLFLFFMLAAAAVACGMIFVKPSEACGPFRGQDTTYEVVTELIDSWQGIQPGLHEFIKIITSPGFITGVLIFLCVGTYYMRILMIGHREMVTLLRQQLTMEGRDKVYLLGMLQDVSRRSKIMTKNSRLLNSPQQDSPTANEVGRRMFIKTVAQASAASGPSETGSPKASHARRRHQDNISGASS